MPSVAAPTCVVSERPSTLPGEAKTTRGVTSMEAAPRSAVGSGRKGIRLRGAEWPPDAGRALRRPQSARRLPRDVRPGRGVAGVPLDDASCHGCSFWADNFNGIIVHLNHRDVTMIAVSRAPYAKIAAYSKRMGWTFHWVSSGKNDFNFDYRVSFSAKEVAEKKADYNYTIQDPMHSEREGLSVFTKDAAGKIFHTYSAYARGIDMVNVAYHYLDLVPKGRDEGNRGPHWVRRHDEYGG